ncbi:heavy metal-associated isoprenylated plant protein 5 [Quercus suber]|uniref:Heavy metal-associated isoprenylated plant protein 5 n=1 Tax=Quercus suber TaxID=58331 RepID=A0AAW0M1V4_QUESU|nr:heavy metal-associated isoprenylated plant protein 5-like [Quercus suber]POF08503.1 heavy metal-associated isoprenylated plant protein 5 [Quercus suber]
MGEKEGEKKGGDNKVAPAPAPAEKKDDVSVTGVYKIDLHCEGCAKKVKRTVRHFDGVEEVKTDCGANKVTVKGTNVDFTAIKEKLEEKIKRKVELVSPQPKKDGGGGGDKKPEEKKAEKKEEPKKPKESTVVYKIKLHCDGCISKIKRIIRKYDGVESVEVDKTKEQVTVKGTMEVKELTPYLTEKLKRSVDVVPPPKKDDGGGGGGDKKPKEGGGDKKEKEAAPAAPATGGGGEKKEKEKEKEGGGGGGEKKEEGGEAPKVEVSKMMYGGFPYHSAPMFWDGHVDGQHYPVEVHQGYVNHNAPSTSYGYVNQGYVNPDYEMFPHAHPMHAPQMFSDENPNACSIM